MIPHTELEIQGAENFVMDRLLNTGDKLTMIRYIARVEAGRDINGTPETNTELLIEQTKTLTKFPEAKPVIEKFTGKLIAVLNSGDEGAALRAGVSSELIRLWMI